MKTVTLFNEGNPLVFSCKEDEHHNLWIEDCPDNRRALGLDPQDKSPKCIFGECFVPKNGSVREARENSLGFWNNEGVDFIVGEHKNTDLCSKLQLMQKLVMQDSEYATKVRMALKNL